MFKRFKKKRELIEVLRLRKLLSTEVLDYLTVKEISQQMCLCEALPWAEYNRFCRNY